MPHYKLPPICASAAAILDQFKEIAVPATKVTEGVYTFTYLLPTIHNTTVTPRIQRVQMHLEHLSDTTLGYQIQAPGTEGPIILGSGTLQTQAKITNLEDITVTFVRPDPQSAGTRVEILNLHADQQIATNIEPYLTVTEQMLTKNVRHIQAVSTTQQDQGYLDLQQKYENLEATLAAASTQNARSQQIINQLEKELQKTSKDLETKLQQPLKQQATIPPTVCQARIYGHLLPLAKELMEHCLKHRRYTPTGLRLGPKNAPWARYHFDATLDFSQDLEFMRPRTDCTKVGKAYKKIIRKDGSTLQVPHVSPYPAFFVLYSQLVALPPGNSISVYQAHENFGFTLKNIVNQSGKGILRQGNKSLDLAQFSRLLPQVYRTFWDHHAQLCQ